MAQNTVPWATSGSIETTLVQVSGTSSLGELWGKGVPLFSGQKLGNLSGTEHVFGGQTWDQTQFPLLLGLRSYLGTKPHSPPRLQEVSKDDIFHDAWAK